VRRHHLGDYALASLVEADSSHECNCTYGQRRWCTLASSSL
jgi:hypothetical protein